MNIAFPRFCAAAVLIWAHTKPLPAQSEGYVQGADMREIPAGVYQPLFVSAGEDKKLPVRSFLLAACPVTNAEYLEFVRENPKWRRSAVKRLFADDGYLRHWEGDLELGADAATMARQPVTHVSWFAAKAFCAWKGGRLPTVAEWELAASAGFASLDGSKEREFVNAVARWYSTPSNGSLAQAGAGRPNVFGVQDLHGLVWEWTGDFNASMVTGDARGDTGLDRQMFCGAGSVGVSDRANFPAFMRSAFRSSLKASYTVPNLGFRLAKER